LRAPSAGRHRQRGNDILAAVGIVYTFDGERYAA